jgi:hypothetical protein
MPSTNSQLIPDQYSPTPREAIGDRWAFNAFAILFLLTLLAGMVNFIGSWWKYRG